jgi:hypothetical protein
MVMTEQSLNELLCSTKLKFPKTFTDANCKTGISSSIIIGGTDYFQSTLYLPATAQTESDLFYLTIFLGPKTYKSELSQFYASYKKQELYCVLMMVLAMTAFLFMLIWCIIARFSGQITRPINTLTDYTNELKKKRSIEEKQQFVKSILRDKIFEKAHAVWETKYKNSP